MLGDEARENGLKLSLLERLQLLYDSIGGPAKDYSVTLSTNYRCHRDILAIPHQLFYSGLKCKARKSDPHPRAPYPLLFVCSNLTSDVCSPKIEAKVLLDQVDFFVKHWPSSNISWGDFELKKIAVVMSTQPQVYLCYIINIIIEVHYIILLIIITLQLVVTRSMGRTEFSNLYRIRLLTLYRIQGDKTYCHVVYTY